MKKLSLLLAMVMALSCLALPGMAESTAIQENAAGYYYVEAAGDQPLLTAASADMFMQADGLYFKDMNGNGELDAYEDWRLDTDARITDLLSQMTLEEKAGVTLQTAPFQPIDDTVLYSESIPLEGLSGYYTRYSVYNDINLFHVTTFLENQNGLPNELADKHNKMQAIAENTRLSIPLVFTVDREYNGWGGYIDLPHDAFGTAGDAELMTRIMSAYAKEMRAAGYHVVLHPFSVEIGSYYGEDPAYIAPLVEAEVKAYQENGIATTAKHFVGRGGDSSFGAARSVAQNVENWMIPWKAAINAGTKWVMTTTSGYGLSNNTRTDYDVETMRYLRETLGFTGIVITDVGPVGSAGTYGNLITGTYEDGTDLATLTNPQYYAIMLKNGVDLFEGQISTPDAPLTYCNYPEDIVKAVTEGWCEEADLDRACTNILRFKFDEGLFENPYVDPEEAVRAAASDEYFAQRFEINSNETLAQARPAELVEMERVLQAESAVLVKNDGNLLPLQAGTKVYLETSSELLTRTYGEYIGQHGQVVASMEEADVVVLDFSSVNDSLEQLVEDAKAAGKKLVLSLNNTDPTTWAVANADALLFLNFNRPIDHGTGSDSIVGTTEPVVFAQLLFGERQPGGQIVKEIARDVMTDAVQWKDMEADQGVSAYVRLLLLAQFRQDASTLPANWSDALLQFGYGMHYGAEPSFEFDTLIVPTEGYETTNAWGRAIISTRNVTQKAGEPFTVSMLVWNRGEDGIENVQVLDGDQVIGEKLVAINDGSYRVVEIEVTIPDAGEHTITVGGLSAQITVE